MSLGASKRIPYTRKLAFIDHPGKVCEKRNRQGQKAYLWKTFFVHVVHHHNFIVKCPTASSRAEQQKQIRVYLLMIY